MRQSQYMSADDIKYLVLHCSASRCNQDYSVEQLRRDHKARGFYDIGTCRGLLPKSVRVWMLAAGLLIITLINSFCINL